MTEDGGGDNGTRGQHVHRRRKYIGYTTCLLFFVVNLFVVSHMLAMAERQRRGGWWLQRQHERTTCTSPKKVRWLYYLSVVVCVPRLCPCLY